MLSLKKRYLFPALALLALGWLIYSVKGVYSHSFRFEPVLFPCNEIGCMSGDSDNSERCKCGEVDLKRELPCGGSHPCQCGFSACTCGKYCDDIKEPCTAAQECKSNIKPTPPQQ